MNIPLKKALLSSYQSAIVQKYNVQKESLASNIISIITKLQDNQEELNEAEKLILTNLEEEYPYLATFERTTAEYINQLKDIVDDLTTQ